MLEVIPILSIFKDKINNLFDIIHDDLAQELDKSFMIYTQNWFYKISHTKTFLFRDTRVDFNDIYFPISVISKTNPYSDIDSFDDIFRETNCATILGHAGCGKTMLVRHLFLKSLKIGYKIPIIIELRRLNSENLTFTDYVSKTIFNFDLAKSQRIMNRLFQNGDFLFFLDGYDELSLDTKQKRTNEIENFIDRYPNNDYILTSRPEDEIYGLQRFDNYYVKKLSKPQVKEFIHKQLALIDDGVDLERKMLPLVDSASENIAAYFSNPLLLSLFILTFRYRPELPKRKTDFYFNVFDTLFTKHDSITKGGGFIHDKASGLDRCQIEKIIKYFSFRTYFKQQFTFTEEDLHNEIGSLKSMIGFDFDIDKVLYDLEVSISFLVKDGTIYTFPHRSMQEYFTALLLMELPEQLRLKIYRSKGFSNSSNVNLWSLCEELNPYDLKKNFILPNFHELLRKLDDAVNVTKNKEKVLLDYIINRTKLYINFHFGEIANYGGQDIENMQIIYFAGFEYSFVNTIVITIKEHYEELKPHMSVKKDNSFGVSRLVNIVNLYDDKRRYMPYLIKYGLPQKLWDIYIKLHEYTVLLQQQIDQEEEENKTLLDLL